MKIISPSLMIIFLKNSLNLKTMIISTLIIISTYSLFNHEIMITNQLYLLDHLSLMLILLTLTSMTLIIISSSTLKEIMKFMSPIMIILLMTFSLHSMFYFYIMFELVLIPTMILITKAGKQPERLQAGIYLLIYTITASLPLLTSILLMKNNSSFTLIYLCMYKYKFIMFMMLAFLVKMPMFMTHLWLPKAHVEAPLEGSMILAAILLKLGGYGLIRFFPLFIHKMNSMNFWILSISMLGATATSMNCIRQKDLKSLIAYSSVAHMGLVLSSIYTTNKMGLSGAIMMMIAHGLASSALFLLVNDLYSKIHTRNIIMFKGTITTSPNIIFWWFMFTAVNISAPPSINTFSEIFIMSSLIMWSSMMIFPIMISSLMTASFSLSLFINMSHNKNEMSPFISTPQKIHLSLFTHLIPLILMTTKMETMYM